MKRIILSSFAILFSTLLWAVPALPLGNIIKIEVVETGPLNNQPLFQVKGMYAGNSSYLLVIKDEFGSVLHEEVLGPELRPKQFLLNAQELGTALVVFEIYHSNGILHSVSKHKLLP